MFAGMSDAAITKPDMHMKLSDHFQLYEFCNSETANKAGIDNTPNKEQIENLRGLCVTLLEPLRFFIGKPITICSGLRVEALNKLVGGSDSSAHLCVGQAASDIEVDGIDNNALAHIIRDGGFIFDQVILEFYKAPVPSSGWVHVAWRKVPRYQALTARKNKDGKVVYVDGFPPA